MEGGSFKSEDYGWAKNTEKMNSKSSKDFRWSVRLNAGTWIGIGIASKLQQANECIEHYDKNAIMYHPFYAQLNKGDTHSRIDFARAKLGDAIEFRFQPKLKKFSFSFVCSTYFY